MTVRVRFAPSPTGPLHIGGARTALYNFLYARHAGGVFLLRVEDTDQTRSTRESLQSILDGLRWMGLDWDEGPIFQSERLERYRMHAQRLADRGRAQWRDGALYFLPDREVTGWKDLILGDLSRDTSGDPDLVILKSDGFPTYNFACVVDDAELGITHVLRGQEHIPNTPKQISLYRALGFEPPRFGHIPLILDPAGAKISKRRTYDFPVTVDEVRSMGYLPEPFVNFLALLGWSPGGDRERMTLREMIESFTLERVNSSPARFLRDKLDWLNGLAIREMELDRLVEHCRPYLEKAYNLTRFPDATIRAAVAQQQERLKRLDEIVHLTEFVFREDIEPDEEARKILRREESRRGLAVARAALEAADWSQPAPLEQALRQAAQEAGLAFKHVSQPVRAAVTGRTYSPPIHETLWIVGRERALARVRRVLDSPP
jgi:glutamyl-tRNA synthetase